MRINGGIPDGIPLAPAVAYKKKGWKSWGDWLGNGNFKPGDNIYLEFSKAREIARSFKLNSNKDWNKRFLLENYGKSDLPASPDSIYRNKGWISWPDWLGKV